MKQIISTLLMLFCFSNFAQSFLKKPTSQGPSFKEQQRQFEQFRKQNNLNTAKHWKHFKRYEYEMSLHTNGRGEPDGFSAYISEALAASAAMEQQRGAAASWAPFGTNAVPTNLQGYAENGIGRINCVAFHPTDTNTYYVGVAQGGLWKTTNGGQSYTPLTDNLPITRISDISIDPTNPNTIYISLCDFEYVGFGLYLNGRKRHTHFGLGVYKSTDAGASWSPTGLTFQLTNGDASLIRKIIVNPLVPSEVLACGVNGMYRSTNGGQTWNRQIDSVFWDMVQDPVNTNVLYAASGWIMTSDIGSAGIYKSTNFGASWTLLNTSIPPRGSVQRIKLAIAPTNNNMIYALTCDDQYGLYGVYQSTNAGGTWTYKPPVDNILEWDQGQNSGGQGTYDLALVMSDTNDLVFYTGGINIWGTVDGGTSFNPVSHWTYNFGNSTIHADVHFMAKQPGSKNIFVACDGGLYKTRNISIDSWTSGWNTNWTNISNGMQISSFYRVSSSRNAGGRISAGAQDNSTFYFDGSGWSTIFGGDGMDNYLSPANNQEVIGSSQYGNFYLSTNGGMSGSVMGTNPNFEASEWVTPIVADYKNPGVLYVGNENIVKSTDYGVSWFPLNSIYSNTVTQMNTEISALAVSSVSSNVIYATRRVRYELNMKGIVFKSTNGGAAFTNITSNLPDTLYYTGIETSPYNASEVVVCMAGFAAGCKVFKTVNGGMSWSNITYNLPNLPVNCIKYVEGTGQLLVATDIGLYYLNPYTSNWVNYSTGLPNVILSDIEFNPVLDKIYVSTFGRGIWSTGLSALKALYVVGITEREKNVKDFKLYPSPNKGSFTVNIDADLAGASITLIDVMGRELYQSIAVEGENRFDLKLLPGAYYIRLENSGYSGVRKMIVE